MIKKGVFLFIFSVAFIACQNENSFKIEGTFEDLSNSTVYLNEMGLSNSEVIDSSKIDKDGDFSFRGESEYPRFYQLALSDNEFITLLIKPGEEVSLNLDSDNLYDYTVQGSPGTEKVKRLNRRLRNTTDKLDSLKNLYHQTEKMEASRERLDEIDQSYRELLNRQRDSSIAFILDNMGSLASIMALYQKVDEENFVLYKNQDLQYIKLVADSLKEKYPQSKHVKSLIADKDRLMQRYKNMEVRNKLNRMSDKMGTALPDITLPDVSGDTVSFSGLDNKMILLSFWSAGHNACLERNLKLKEVYRKYHKKGFEIYQVSLNKDKERWKKGVNFDELPWINVHSSQGANAQAARIYNVKELPTDYLIKNGEELIVKNPKVSKLERHLSRALN